MSVQTFQWQSQLALAKNALISGDYFTAETCLTAAMNFSHSENAPEEAIADIFYHRGICYESRERYIEARRSFNQALHTFSRCLGPTSSQAVKAAKAKSLIEIKLGNNAEARRQFALILDLLKKENGEDDADVKSIEMQMRHLFTQAEPPSIPVVEVEIEPYVESESWTPVRRTLDMTMPSLPPNFAASLEAAKSVAATSNDEVTTATGDRPKIESDKIESEKIEAGEAVPVKGAPTKIESVKAEPTKANSAQPESVAVDSAKEPSGFAEPAREEKPATVAPAPPPPSAAPVFELAFDAAPASPPEATKAKSTETPAETEDPWVLGSASGSGFESIAAPKAEDEKAEKNELSDPEPPAPEVDVKVRIVRSQPESFTSPSGTTRTTPPPSDQKTNIDPESAPPPHLSIVTAQQSFPPELNRRKEPAVKPPDQPERRSTTDSIPAPSVSTEPPAQSVQAAPPAPVATDVVGAPEADAGAREQSTEAASEEGNDESPADKLSISISITPPAVTSIELPPRMAKTITAPAEEPAKGTDLHNMAKTMMDISSASKLGLSSPLEPNKTEQKSEDSKDNRVLSEEDWCKNPEPSVDAPAKSSAPSIEKDARPQSKTEQELSVPPSSGKPLKAVDVLRLSEFQQRLSETAAIPSPAPAAPALLNPAAPDHGPSAPSPAPAAPLAISPSSATDTARSVSPTSPASDTTEQTPTSKAAPPVTAKHAHPEISATLYDMRARPVKTDLQPQTETGRVSAYIDPRSARKTADKKSTDKSKTDLPAHSFGSRATDAKPSGPPTQAPDFQPALQSVDAIPAEVQSTTGTTDDVKSNEAKSAEIKPTAPNSSDVKVLEATDFRPPAKSDSDVRRPAIADAKASQGPDALKSAEVISTETTSTGNKTIESQEAKPTNFEPPEPKPEIKIRVNATHFEAPAAVPAVQAADAETEAASSRSAFRDKRSSSVSSSRIPKPGAPAAAKSLITPRVLIRPLDVDSLRHPRDLFYSKITKVAAIVVYLLSCIMVVGFALIPLAFLANWVLRGLQFGSIRGRGIKVSPDQFPEVYEAMHTLSAELGMAMAPDTYVVNDHRFAHAVAKSLNQREIVVIYADVLELAYSFGEAELAFVLAHELAHVRCDHLKSPWVDMPVRLIPFLGNALSRARELTCDRIAQELVPEGALMGLVALAAGTKLYRRVNLKALYAQQETEWDFWTWFSEVRSSYPNLINRIRLLGLKDERQKTASPKGSSIDGV